MVNSVITPTVTYAMCSIKLPVGVIENIDRQGNNASGGVTMTLKRVATLWPGLWFRNLSPKVVLG